jgi:hypothetical protein
MATNAYQHRKSARECLICENGLLRLRIGEHAGEATLLLDACDAGGQWVPLAWQVPALDLRIGARRQPGWFAFEPLLLDGETRGVVVHGGLGAHAVTCTLRLDDAGAWCHQQLDITGSPAPVTVRWRLTSIFTRSALAWPREPVAGAALAANLAAFVQQGASLAACIPDLEETAGLPARMTPHAGRTRGWSYTVSPGRDGTLPRLACALCLDARALPERGFQQLVRRLGARAALRLLPGTAVEPGAHPLPPLPMAGAHAWTPFDDEGTPAEMTAHVQALLAASDDWMALEEALVWLDRLCLQQRVVEAGDGVPLGVFGDGPAWATVAPWLPVLLMDAFRHTGIDEYAWRARAALHALPPASRRDARAALHARVGDLYVQADFHAHATLAPLEYADVEIEDATLYLTLPPAPRPQRLVADGSEVCYRLIINGADMGEYPTRTLRDGIEL